jgi:hypothetical protein
MKPSDHPDFFRLPPPPGRSRDSTIVLDAEGNFRHDGEKVVHPGMARAFASWIARHPDDGRFILTNGYDWTYFTVEGPPYFVESVKATDRGLTMILFDGSEEQLDPKSLTLDAEGAFHTTVKNGAFQAKFRRTAQLELAPFFEEGEGGRIVLSILGVTHEIAPSPLPTC